MEHLEITACLTSAVSDQVSVLYRQIMAAYLGRLKLPTIYIVRSTGFLPCVEKYTILGWGVYTLVCIRSGAVHFGVAFHFRMLRCAVG